MALPGPMFPCGVWIDVASAKWKTVYDGQTYYFCAPGCLVKFEKDPETFLQRNPRPGIVHTLCGGEIDVTTAQWKSEYQGRTYYFCAAECQNSFADDPEQYPETYL